MNPFELEAVRLNEVLDRAVDGAHLSYTRVCRSYEIKTQTTAEGPATVVGDRISLGPKYDVRNSKRFLDPLLVEVSVTAKAPTHCYRAGGEYAGEYLDALWDVGAGEELNIVFIESPASSVLVKGILQQRDGDLFIDVPWRVMDGVEGSSLLPLTTGRGNYPLHETKVSELTAYRPQEFVWRGALCEENYDIILELERLREKLMGS